MSDGIFNFFNLIMKRVKVVRAGVAFFAIVFLMLAAVSLDLAADTPMKGDVAQDFTLNTLDGKAVELKELTAKQPVVLVVLRGWPGYQCPFCTRQVQDFLQKSGEFSGKAQVLMVYPGPAENLREHAKEFVANKQWPMDFLLVSDPDFTFTKAYGLRWNAKNETAYPSTFVIDTHGKIRFAHISKEHGDRVSANEALKVVEGLKR